MIYKLFGNLSSSVRSGSSSLAESASGVDEEKSDLGR